ncbi:DoxX family protein [Mucilaginibacter aquaedulcis]|uniref:DoxX family protein n=1 Tax=Mucilaginibacter aquaedulcis TaxID=1187081 RepID=UPI0025B5927C|nr:DoxX family protein [Mucilaginibacter aquaedulcis]MDN3549181.1 DoxX family protein [Mucilaginibacter aquaedulcis]
MAILDNLQKHSNTGLLILRIGVGIMFIIHGFPKLIEGPQAWEGLGGSMKVIGINFLLTFWGFMAVVSEVVGGILLIIGLFFRPALLLLISTMVVATLTHFSNHEGLQAASHAIELGIVFISLVFIGPGEYSLDERM